MLDFCGHSSAIASAGRHARLFVDLQGDVDDLLRMIRHLMVYDVVAADFYGFDPRKRQREIHIRQMGNMVGSLLALDNQKLSVALAREQTSCCPMPSLCALSRRRVVRQGHSHPGSVRLRRLFQSSLL